MILDDVTRRAIASFGDPWTMRPLQRVLPIADYRALDGASGVYVVTDAARRVLYVGSAHRPGTERGMADRLEEHLRDPRKRMRWTRVWALRLVGYELTLAHVRTVEAMVGGELQPTWNARLPALLV